MTSSPGILTRCNKCGEDQNDDGFYWRGAERKNQRRQPCKQCISDQGTIYRNSDRANWNKITRRSYYKHREQSRVRSRAKTLLKEYGITVPQYEAMVAAQDGRCAICRKLETVTDPRYGQIRLLAVDHCHITGGVRGLLCSRCNMALGMFGDDLDRIMAVAAYLKLYEGGASDARATA